MTKTIKVDRAQILAFRLSGHHLLKRSPSGNLAEVTGACGIRNTPPGSALLALHARLEGTSPEVLDVALAAGDGAGTSKAAGALAEVLAMRISPHLVPIDDLAIFTLGALPREEASAQAVLANLKGAFEGGKQTALGAIEQATEASKAELADGPLERGPLSAGMTRRLPKALSPFCKPCDTDHVSESLFRLAGVGGAFLIERDGKRTVYVRTGQRVRARATGDRLALRDHLLRRYLRCFGPSTPQDFAAWVGIGNDEARADFDRIADSLIEIEVASDGDGDRGAADGVAPKRSRSKPSASVIHCDDLADLQAHIEAEGVRFLPPYDAYLDQRDRLMLLPNKVLHKRVWAALGAPGTLLVHGEIAGIWRAKKAGKRLTVTVEPFSPLPEPPRAETEVEAQALGPIRECRDIEVVISG